MRFIKTVQYNTTKLPLIGTVNRLELNKFAFTSRSRRRLIRTRPAELGISTLSCISQIFDTTNHINRGHPRSKLPLWKLGHPQLNPQAGVSLEITTITM